jgi:hypothetical protein
MVEWLIINTTRRRRMGIYEDMKVEEREERDDLSLVVVVG